MKEVIIREGHREKNLRQIRKEREGRPLADRLSPAPKAPSFRHPSAVRLFMATRQLAEQARSFANLGPDDLNYAEARNNLTDAAENVGFKLARQAVRRVYSSGADRRIIDLALRGAREVTDTEVLAIKRVILRI